MSEDVQSHIKTYKKIGIALMILTVVTVAISYAPLGVPLAITVALIVAITKGSLVVSFFMHLLEEKPAITAMLLMTVVFFFVLMFIPIFHHADRLGDYFTLPNADAPTVDHSAEH